MSRNEPVSKNDEVRKPSLPWGVLLLVGLLAVSGAPTGGTTAFRDGTFSFEAKGSNWRFTTKAAKDGEGVALFLNDGRVDNPQIPGKETYGTLYFSCLLKNNRWRELIRHEMDALNYLKFYQYAEDVTETGYHIAMTALVAPEGINKWGRANEAWVNTKNPANGCVDITFVRHYGSPPVLTAKGTISYHHILKQGSDGRYQADFDYTYELTAHRDVGIDPMILTLPCSWSSESAYTANGVHWRDPDGKDHDWLLEEDGQWVTAEKFVFRRAALGSEFSVTTDEHTWQEKHSTDLRFQVLESHGFGDLPLELAFRHTGKLHQGHENFWVDVKFAGEPNRMKKGESIGGRFRVTSTDRTPWEHQKRLDEGFEKGWGNFLGTGTTALETRRPGEKLVWNPPKKELKAIIGSATGSNRFFLDERIGMGIDWHPQGETVARLERSGSRNPIINMRRGFRVPKSGVARFSFWVVTDDLEKSDALAVEYNAGTLWKRAAVTKPGVPAAWWYTENGIPRHQDVTVPLPVGVQARNMRFRLVGEMKEDSGKDKDRVFVDTVKCYTRPNQAPVANYDMVGIRGGESKTVSVLDNDYDLEGHPLTLVSVAALDRSIGTARKLKDGKIQLEMKEGFSGMTRLAYTVSDGELKTKGQLLIRGK